MSKQPYRESPFFRFFRMAKKQKQKAKCSILTEDGKVFSFFADMQSKCFDMLMLTKENDEVKFDYDPACSSLDYFTSKTIQA